MLNPEYSYCEYDSSSQIRNILSEAFSVNCVSEFDDAYVRFIKEFYTGEGEIVTLKRKNFHPKTTDNVFINEQFLNKNFTILMLIKHFR